MATTSGRSHPSVIEQLSQEPHQFDFFQAVRLLEQARSQEHAAAGEDAACSVGQDLAPEREAVRFRALASLGFPASAISKLALPESDESGAARPAEMTVSFLGLTGPSGVLPQHYTSLVIERSHQRHRDTTLRDFLDLFHHRSISLFYRAWEKYRFPYAFERWMVEQDDQERDQFTLCLFSLVGLGTDHQRGRFHFPVEALIHYGGHFAQTPRNACCLQQVIQDHFHVDCEVQQFCGQWLYLSERDQTSLPGLKNPEGQNVALGVSTVVGSRVWDVEGKFRVKLGPMNYDEFEEFLPTGSQLLPICEMIRLYAGPQFDFDVQVVLKKEEVPMCQLGRTTAGSPRLGWNTWIHSSARDADAQDAIFRIPGL